MSKAKTSTALDSARKTLAAEMDGLRQLSASLGEDFERAVDMLAATKGRVIVSGIGKSGHIATKITATLASTGTRAHYVHPSEASHGDLGMIANDDIVLGLSWSGETPELASLLTYTKRFAIPLIALTSNPDSALGKAASLCLTLPNAPEACPNGLAPTTSTTMQLALGDALAVALLQKRGFTASDFKNFHPGGKLGARLTTIEEIMHIGDTLPLVADTMKMSDALVEMTAKGFGCLGVVATDGKLVGMITDGDLRRHMGPAMLEKTTADIMTKDPKTIGEKAMAAEALGLMNSKKIQSLFVCQKSKPVGLVHLHDLLRLGAA